jgi:iron(III) transport system substrate-binding protein
MIGRIRIFTRGLAIAAMVGAVGIAAAMAPQGVLAADPSWMDKGLLAKAKKEGGKLVVYGSMNEREALPLWKIFDKATGLNTVYVRASDVKLMARITVEMRAGKPGWDILQTTAVHKLPPKWVAQYVPPLAKEIPDIAKAKDKRWYGVYANYNSPAFNTSKVKKSELPKTYEDFLKRPQWKGRVAIDYGDNEWLKAVVLHYGAKKGEKLMRDIKKKLGVKVTRGHGALARNTASGEHMISLNNYVNLTIRTKLKGNPIDWWVMDPVAVFYGQVGISSSAKNPSAARLGANYLISREGQTQLAKSGRIPTRTDVTPNPPDVLKIIGTKKVIPVIMSGKEDRKWDKKFKKIFGKGPKKRKK